MPLPPYSPLTEDIMKAQQLEPLTDGSNAPWVMYLILYKYTTCFIAGALSYRNGDIGKAETNAAVKPMKDCRLFAEAKPDFFGEFKIDRIPKNSGVYELTCSLEGHAPLTREVTVSQDSPCLDVMIFV